MSFDDDEVVPRKTAKSFVERFEEVKDEIEPPTWKKYPEPKAVIEESVPPLNISTADSQNIHHKLFEEKETTNEFVNTQHKIKIDLNA